MQTRSQTLQSAEQEPIEFVSSSRSSRQTTAPPRGGMTAMQDMPDLFDSATTSPVGQTETMQQFFPTTYKKKTTLKKTTTTTQQKDNSPSTSGSHEVEDNSDEAQPQGEETIQITASEGIPAWMFWAAEAARNLLQSFDAARRTRSREPQVSFSDLGARLKTSKQKTWSKESPRAFHDSIVQAMANGVFRGGRRTANGTNRLEGN